MNAVSLNTVNLDGGVTIKKGSGGGGTSGGVSINNQEKSVEITENSTTEVRYDAGYTGLEKVSIKVAIPNEEKTVEITDNGITEVVADRGFLNRVIVNTNVASSGGGTTPSGSQWTGHADTEGLKAIGWTNGDIAYYQENGVNWNEEEDEFHKVTDDNKALYGVLTADNISTYKDMIVYLPKIDTSNVTDMSSMFKGCRSLISIPQLNTAKVNSMNSMFYQCYSLTSIPQLNTANVTDMSSMFYQCYSLLSIPQLDTTNVTSMLSMFYYCYSLTSIPQLNTQKVEAMNQMFQNCFALTSIPQLDTTNVTNMASMFYQCYSLSSAPQLDTTNVTDMVRMFYSCYALASIVQLDTAKVTNLTSTFDSCYSLTHVNLKNIDRDYYFTQSPLLSKESLLYIINNEAATDNRTIKLAPYAYTRLANDPDIVAALAKHRWISIAQ